MDFLDKIQTLYETIEDLKKDKIQLIMFLEFMEYAFREKRTDVADLCSAALNGFFPNDKSNVEHRYIKAQLPNGVEVEYDTLTTLLSYHEPNGQWTEASCHEYYDDEEE